MDKIVLQNRSGENSTEIPVIGYTTEPPLLWEQYDDYTLVQILPLSVWNTFYDRIDSAEADSYMRILTFDDGNLNKDMAVIQEILESDYTIEIHNRVQDLVTDEQMWQGLNFFMSAGCGLLAMIGAANIFSYTLGFIYQRKREFAQYLSIGVTPREIKKILWIEALIIAGKPMLLTLPLTALFMAVMIKASYMKISQFLSVAPVLPILIYIAAVFTFVGIAYYIGGKRLMRIDLGEILRNDAMS